MEEYRIVGDDGWYRGTDLMNIQKKALFQRLKEIIVTEQGELAHLLEWKERNTEKYSGYKREWEKLCAHEGDPVSIKILEEKMEMINKQQGEILIALQPLFHEIFDQVAEEIPPGIEYNDALRHDVRFDLIFGERDIPGGTIEGSREYYRIEQYIKGKEERFQRRIQKILERRQQEKEKIRLPKDHRLVTEKNYPQRSKRIAKYMELGIQRYANLLAIDNKNTLYIQNILEKFFVYLFIYALIESKFIFDIKSTRGTKCLDLTVEAVLEYFENMIYKKLDIKPKDVKKKLWSNMHSNDGPFDLVYKYAFLEDIEKWESYLDENYFIPKGSSAEKLRREIMQEYNAQKGIKEMAMQLINPLYYIYKDEVEKHQKHVHIIQEYIKRNNDQSPYLQEILNDIKTKLSYAQEKKKEYTVLEENIPKITPKYDHSLTEIIQKHLKRFQVPVQYRRIYGIIINKINNFYQLKIGLIKKADKHNAQLFEQIVNTDRGSDQIMYFMNNYITNKYIDKIFDEKWNQKRSERKILFYNYIKDTKKIERKTSKTSISKDNIPKKESKNTPPEQLTIDF